MVEEVGAVYEQRLTVMSSVRLTELIPYISFSIPLINRTKYFILRVDLDIVLKRQKYIKKSVNKWCLNQKIYRELGAARDNLAESVTRS